MTVFRQGLPWLGTILLLAGPAVADSRAISGTLPPALKALHVGPDQFLTRSEAAEVRGEALDTSSVYAAAASVLQRAQVLELPGGVFYFQGVYFGEGLLINQQTGRGVIFSPDNPSAGAIFFSGLRGNYAVQRDAQGFIQFFTPP
jgi:hypothetical protein